MYFLSGDDTVRNAIIQTFLERPLIEENAYSKNIIFFTVDKEIAIAEGKVKLFAPYNIGELQNKAGSHPAKRI